MTSPRRIGAEAASKVVLLVALVAGCPRPEEDLSCGPGTIEVEDECVPTGDDLDAGLPVGDGGERDAGDGADAAPDAAACPDSDVDGHASVECGGDDCADDEPEVHPGAGEVANDGIDSDCDGHDPIDADFDGHLAAADGGDDCRDDSAEIHPGALEVVGDGVDADCDGLDPRDDDLDGYVAAEDGGDDCGDDDDSIHPGALDGPAWAVEVVDDLANTGHDVRIAATSTGAAVTFERWRYNAELQEVEMDLMLGTYSRLGWDLRLLASQAGCIGSSLVADANDSLHLAYHQCALPSPARELMYAADPEDAWAPEIVFSAEDCLVAAAVAADLNGIPQILFGHDCGGSVSAAAPDGAGGWTTTPILGYENIGHAPQPAIAFDAAGVAHAHYFGGSDPSFPTFYYAENSSGAFVAEEVPTAEPALWTLDSDFWVQPDGVPHIVASVHQEALDPRDLIHLWKEGGSWSQESVGSGQVVAVDGDETSALHIVVQNLERDGVVYATNASGAWATEDVVAGAFSGSFTAIAVRSEQVWIAYQLGSESEDDATLEVAHRPLPNGLDDDCDGAQW